MGLGILDAGFNKNSKLHYRQDAKKRQGKQFLAFLGVLAAPFLLSDQEFQCRPTP
jgi:hypothetical protein